MPVGGRALEELGWRAQRDLGARKETRGVGAEDLVAAIAVEPLRAPVPARDVTVDRQHEDGEILHALDQQSEVLLVRAKRVLGVLALREVARDGAEATELVALGVLRRSEVHPTPEGRPVLAHEPPLVVGGPFSRGLFEEALDGPPLELLLRE